VNVLEICRLRCSRRCSFFSR